MTREQVMMLLATAGNDLDAYVDSKGNVRVTVQDFEGFDEDWAEIDRELDNEELVKSIEEILEASALSVTDDLYYYFEFDGFMVVWGFASFDI